MIDLDLKRRQTVRASENKRGRKKYLGTVFFGSSADGYSI